MSKVHLVAAGATPLAAYPEAEAKRHEQGQPMTPEQSATLRTLCEELGEPFDGQLTRWQAAERIDYLKSVRD
jgi:uncharacterized damage-inducible protein DinB